MKESTLQKKIKKALQKEGGFWVKVHGGPYQRVGLPDLIGCYKGKFIGIEVKVPGREDTLTKRQSRILRQIESEGGIAFMSTSVEMTMEKLREYGIGI